MYDLKILSEAMGEIGRSYVSLDFGDHPIWNKLSGLSAEATSTALIDNTLMRNALRLIRDGLGDENSGHAMLLPDLSILFFGLTHFEKLILLDHGMTKEELKEIGYIFPNMIDVFGWRMAMDNDSELKNNLWQKFKLIQGAFSDRIETHDGWVDAWSCLLGKDQKIRPLYFTEGVVNSLLDSPSHPLHRDVEGLDENWPGILNRALPERSRFNQPRTFRGLPFSDQCSLVASYHTFRSIFYYCLSEHLNYPYLACGMRGVATNFLPVEFLTRDADHLNPKVQATFIQLAMSPTYKREPPVVQLPLIRVTPSLANVMQKIRDFNVPNWPRIVAELRGDSYEYRKDVRNLLAACTDEAFDYGKVVSLAKALAGNRVSAWEAGASVAKIVGTLGGSYVTKNPGQTVEGLINAAKTNPLDLIANWAQRRKLTFILRARDLASSTLSLQDECKKTWKRGFSLKERRYLERLKKSNPIYGL